MGRIFYIPNQTFYFTLGLRRRCPASPWDKAPLCCAVRPANCVCQITLPASRHRAAVFMLSLSTALSKLLKNRKACRVHRSMQRRLHRTHKLDILVTECSNCIADTAILCSIPLWFGHWTFPGWGSLLCTKGLFQARSNNPSARFHLCGQGSPGIYCSGRIKVTVFSLSAQFPRDFTAQPLCLIQV